MKRIMSLLLVTIMLLSFTSCGNSTTPTADKYCTQCGNGMAENDVFCASCGAEFENTTTSSNSTSTTITINTSSSFSWNEDYKDASSFEKDLNNKTNVAGKIVRFEVTGIKPDSAFGFNCYAGEHLNFISENELDVVEGSIVVGQITEEPATIFGSWIIFYNVLEIDGKQTGVTIVHTTTNTTKKPKITVTMDEEDFENLTTEEAAEKLRKMGFVNFEYNTISAGDDSSLDNKVFSVSIKSWLLGSGDFSKGDTFEEDATVILCSYEYKKPEAVSYSTNDKKTVKNGDSGVYAYKKDGEAYDNYLIIDFDEGYVYSFAHGNGDVSADKVKIDSGTLNTVVMVTYHDGNTTWSNGLHFKYKNQPSVLILEDNDGFECKYYTTNLNDVLDLLKTKEILNY